jgi:hypothetical protein
MLRVDVSPQPKTISFLKDNCEIRHFDSVGFIV